jgi:hypothetical protein
MNGKLTPRDVERLAREMNERLAAVESTGDYFTDAAALALIVCEYPPAVGQMYTMMAIDQLVRGNPVIRTMKRGRP